MNPENKSHDKTGDILKKPILKPESLSHAFIEDLKKMRLNYEIQIKKESADPVMMNDPNNKELILGLLADLEAIEAEIKKRMQ